MQSELINLLQGGYITTCLTVEYSGFSIYLSVAYQVVALLLVSEDEKAVVACISCLTKVRPLLHVTPYVSNFLNYNDWKHFATDIFWASQHTSLHNISFLYTSRFASVLFFLGKQFWCLKMLALKQLVGRLPSDELMAKLPSFLVVLFDAFDNQNAEVRKVHI